MHRVIPLLLALTACTGTEDDTFSEIDHDGDGVTVEDGDCEDNNASVYPAALELCDGLDQDCDGWADDRCLQGREAAHWVPLWPGTPAQSGRYCSAPWGPDDVEGIECAASGLAEVAVGPMTVADWYRYRAFDGEVSLDVPLISAATDLDGTDWALTATVELSSATPEITLADGTSFGWIGLVFDDGELPASGLRLFPESWIRMDYQGPYGPGGGRTQVRLDEPVRVVLVRVGQDLDFYLDGVSVGHRVVPVGNPATIPDGPPPDPRLPPGRLRG